MSFKGVLHGKSSATPKPHLPTLMFPLIVRCLFFFSFSFFSLSLNQQANPCLFSQAGFNINGFPQVFKLTKNMENGSLPDSERQ